MYLPFSLSALPSVAVGQCALTAIQRGTFSTPSLPEPYLNVVGYIFHRPPPPFLEPYLNTILLCPIFQERTAPG